MLLIIGSYWWAYQNVVATKLDWAYDWIRNYDHRIGLILDVSIYDHHASNYLRAVLYVDFAVDYAVDLSDIGIN